MLMRNSNTGAFEIYDITNNSSHRRHRWGRSDWSGRWPASLPFRPAVLFLERAAHTGDGLSWVNQWRRRHGITAQSVDSAANSSRGVDDTERSKPVSRVAQAIGALAPTSVWQFATELYVHCHGSY